MTGLRHQGDRVGTGGGVIRDRCVPKVMEGPHPSLDARGLESAASRLPARRKLPVAVREGALEKLRVVDGRVRECVGDWKEVLPSDGRDWRCAIDPAFSRDPFGLAIVGRRREDREQLIVGHVQRWLAPKPKRRIIRSRSEETSYIEQTVAEVAAICARYGITRLISDQHLAGTVESEFAKHGLRVKIAAWTDDSKTAAMRSLRALVNTNRILLPDDPVLISELGRVRTKPGRDKIETPRTGDSHCDVALSVAACVLEHEARPPARPLRVSSVVGRLGRAPGSEGARAADARAAQTQRREEASPVVQNLKPWQAKAPKLPEAPEEVPALPQAEPPPFIAADEREIGEAAIPDEPALEPEPEQPPFAPSLYREET